MKWISAVTFAIFWNALMARFTPAGQLIPNGESKSITGGQVPATPAAGAR